MNIIESLERNLAEQILKRWGNNPHMLRKAALAAELASHGAQQEIFPPELSLGKNSYQKLAMFLRSKLGDR